MRKLLLKTMLLLCALIVGSGTAWADDISFIFTGASVNCNAVSGSVSGITYATGKTGSANATLYNSTNGLVLYGVSSGGGYFNTTTAINGSITNISVTTNNKKNSPKYTVYGSNNGSDWVQIGSQTDGGSTANFETSAGYTYVKIANTTAATAQLGVNSIVITYTPSGSTTTYDVNFDVGDGTFVGNSDFANTSNTVAAGTYTLPSATRAGYTFDGWIVGNNQPVTGSYTVSDNVDFTASYTLGYCATYAVSTTSAVTTSGTAPSNSSATFSQTYTTAKQLTSGKSMTLTLSGYEGKRVKRIVLSMKSNSGSGAGWMSAKAGTTTLASIGSSGSGVEFSNNNWNGAYSTSYGDVEIDMSNTTYDIQEDENIEIYIEATANSLYCESFKIYYEDSPTDPYVNANDVNIAYNATNGSIAYTIGNEPDPAGTLTAAITAGNEGNWLTLGAVSTSVAFTCSANAAYAARTATVRLTYTYGNSETATKDVVITQAAAPLTLTSIALSGTYPTTFYVGDDFSHEGMTVTATYNDNSNEDVTSSATFTGYDMSQTGEQTVTVTYTHNNVSCTQTYTITVNAIPNKTIAEFISADGGKCYLTGTVSNIKNTTYGNFDLTDESGTIYVYGCLTSAGVSAQFSTLNIEAGDVIKVLANEYVYYNNTTDEAKDVIFVEEIVPNAQTLTVSATNGSVVITGKTLENNACEVTEGASVTATATPDEHYTFTSWTAEGVTLADNTANPLTFAMPTNAVTLTANFTEDAKYTATFYVQGVAVNTCANVYEGEAITFPTSVTTPTGYTFMGWTTSAIVGSQNAAPETLVTSANMGNADVNYYAVFAVGTASGNIAGTLSGSDITEWNGIAYNDEETTHTVDNITWSVRGSRGNDNPWIQIRSNNATPSYIKITTSGKLSNVSLSISNASNTSGGVNDITKHGDFGGSIYLSTTTSSDDAIVSATATDKAASLDLPENTNYKEVYIVASGAARIWEVDVTYTGSTYSDYCTTVTPVSATFNASGYATFASNLALDFSYDGDFSAWQITSISGENIYFEQINSSVAAGTGVLLKGTASETVNIPVDASGDDISNTNKLVGITTPTVVAAETYYGLSGNQFKKVNAGTVPAGKALLPATEISSSVRAFTFVFENPTTGISEVQKVSAEEFGEIFNLAGQRLNQPRKGVNIINGKKVLLH